MAQRDWVEKDYYKILGVTKDASKEEIKKAYRKLAQKYHPDTSSDADSEARFKEVSEAHSILSNDEKRREYDQVRQLFEAGGERVYGFTPGRGGGVRINIGDLFGEGDGAGSVLEDLFGFGPRGPRKGADVETMATLSFEDAVAGTTVSLADSSKVRIPPGVRDGQRIKVAGKGRPAPAGGPPGDLFVEVSVRPHPVFELGKNGTLTVRVPITYPEAALGAKVEVPTLGAPVTVKVPAGTPHGKTLRVKGKGAPKRGGGNGDLLVKLGVAVPQKLSRKEKEALQAYVAVHDEDPRRALEPYMKRKAAAS